jgi:hypothetical protein
MLPNLFNLQQIPLILALALKVAALGTRLNRSSIQVPFISMAALKPPIFRALLNRMIHREDYVQVTDIKLFKAKPAYSVYTQNRSE